MARSGDVIPIQRHVQRAGCGVSLQSRGLRRRYRLRCRFGCRLRRRRRSRRGFGRRDRSRCWSRLRRRLRGRFDVETPRQGLSASGGVAGLNPHHPLAVVRHCDAGAGGLDLYSLVQPLAIVDKPPADPVVARSGHVIPVHRYVQRAGCGVGLQSRRLCRYYRLRRGFGSRLRCGFGRRFGSWLRCGFGRRFRCGFGRRFRCEFGRRLRCGFGRRLRCGFGSWLRCGFGRRFRCGFGSWLRCGFGRRLRCRFGRRLRWRFDLKPRCVGRTAARAVARLHPHHPFTIVTDRDAGAGGLHLHTCVQRVARACHPPADQVIARSGDVVPVHRHVQRPGCGANLQSRGPRRSLRAAISARGTSPGQGHGSDNGEEKRKERVEAKEPGRFHHTSLTTSDWGKELMSQPRALGVCPG